MRIDGRRATRVGAAVLLTVLAGCSGGAAPPVATSSVTTARPTTSVSTSIPTVTSRSTSPSTSPGSTPTTTRRTTSVPPTTTRPSPTTATPTSSHPTACSLPPALLGRDLEKIPTSRKVVALTFDAGASNAGVASILATLSEQRVPATFFLTGDFIDAYPSSARAMAAYPVGNHTYNHPDLTTLGDSRVRTEIRSAASRITAVTGQDPRPYFRFPFGAVDSRVVRLVNAECYVPFRWTVDTLGWKGTSGGQSVSSVVNRVLAAATPGEIVLMHVGANPDDGSTLDAAALPRIISGLRAKGYTFVSLEAALGSAP